jgi:hypothetical protein
MVMRCNNDWHIASYHERGTGPHRTAFKNNHEAMQTKGLPHI